MLEPFRTKFVDSKKLNKPFRNMKIILIICFTLFLIVSANAQVKPLTFSMAVKAENVPQKELYKRGKLWFVEKFECSNKMLTLDDATQGVIVAKGTFNYDPKVT